MKDNDIKKVLETAKPDTMMAIEAMQKMSARIGMLSNQLKEAQRAWTEMFVMLGTVLHKFNDEVELFPSDMIALSPETYQITAEEDGGLKIIRLRPKTE